MRSSSTEKDRDVRACVVNTSPVHCHQWVRPRASRWSVLGTIIALWINYFILFCICNYDYNRSVAVLHLIFVCNNPSSSSMCCPQVMDEVKALELAADATVAAVPLLDKAGKVLTLPAKITSRLGELWKGMGESARGPYEALAFADLERFRASMATNQEYVADEARKAAEKEATCAAKQADRKAERQAGKEARRAGKEARRQELLLSRSGQGHMFVSGPMASGHMVPGQAGSMAFGAVAEPKAPTEDPHRAPKMSWKAGPGDSAEI